MSASTTSRNLELYEAEHELLVVLKGRVVLEELDALKQAVLPHIKRGINHVYVDLQKVDYVDSAGLGLLIGFKMTSKMNGAAITLMDPTKTVSDVLSISKIDGIFDFLKGRDALDVRSRLTGGSNLLGSDAHSTDGSGMLMVNSDGTLQGEDDSVAKREQIEDFCRRAVEHMRQGDYEHSIECYKSALELDAEYLPALNNLAIVYEKQPAWHSLAVENWNRVLEISRKRGDEKHVDRAERHLADLKR